MTSRRNNKQNTKPSKQPSATPTKSTKTPNRQTSMTPDGLTLQDLVKKVTDQENVISTLINRIKFLATKVNKLESHIIVSERVQEILATDIDLQEQYSRRSCIIVSGLKKNGRHEDITELHQTVVNSLSETGITKTEVGENIDKLHRSGKYDRKSGTQPVIVKFKTLAFKEKVFENRRKAKHPIKISPSLTKRRSDLLNEINK